MKKILISLMFTTIGIGSIAFADSVNFEGVYQCKGKDPYLHTDYSGSIHIKKAQEVFNVTMQFNKGKNKKEKLLGTGILNPDGNTLSVSSMVVGKKQYSVSAFTMGSDGKTLNNDWANVLGKKIAKETCERQS